MLYFLDNYTSSSAGPNENWARELFELHTLGADHYMGVMQQSQVPTGPGGIPVAYVDDDVFEATTVFHRLDLRLRHRALRLPRRLARSFPEERPRHLSSTTT